VWVGTAGTVCRLVKAGGEEESTASDMADGAGRRDVHEGSVTLRGLKPPPYLLNRSTARRLKSTAFIHSVHRVYLAGSHH
jgi:hypothetical protein